MASIYKKIPVIPVQQPLSTLYLCSISSNELLELSYPDTLTITGVDSRSNSLYKLSGNQRTAIDEKRRAIGRYIDGVEATFPNTVILGANVDSDGYPIKDIDQRWRVEQEGEIFYLIIPVKKMNARVIDGQHRLGGFKYSEKQQHFDIPCSVFLDLPLPLQASIFATININQKKVDRGLAFELFGYDLDEEPMESWSPEKFAIFITRKLNVDHDSPLRGHIKVVPRYNAGLFQDGNWVIATSVFVDGIMGLVSTDPKRDRDKLNEYVLKERKRDKILKADSSPLRSVYLNNNDLLIYTLVANYFRAVDEVFDLSNQRSYLNKTVGVQALFDVLKIISKTVLDIKDISVRYFKEQLVAGSEINFNDYFFQASGIGRSRIKNILLLAMGLQSIDKIKEKDRPVYENLLHNAGSIAQPEKWIWEDEAELELERTFENAEWVPKNNTLILYVGPEEDEVVIKNFEELQQKLNEIAERAAIESMPSDGEMRDQFIREFSSQDIVDRIIEKYISKLKELKWFL